ncbi:sugar ABC transporter ATP-binding protein [Mycetocola tolaasinivorans]|uniref:Sugar ABC transporter ATP-binding protein n=1 Tax=Mycetocola tolaasinivorans TaxID=76635 RepID=A0A3L7A917_9MICO|nr:sugar ABC transporter ATP-binding protein [Mycetocola tolaasinivorans]RLP76829.1 sugar ABC transporter ATP-binding protein [Mycetocola tolaasinivorans]
MINDDHATEPLLSVRALSKEFSGVRALAGVDLEVLPGEVHCLLGQNGAGKSTLIKTLSGTYRPDGGTITWAGEPFAVSSPIEAITLGIATMYQELDVVDGLSVAENIFLGHEKARAGITDRRTTHRLTRELMTRLGHPQIHPGTEVGTLSAANKQIVSMARALSHNARLIIMDEPSAVLDSAEVENLFRVVRELGAAGIAVIYISHRLEEIRQIGHRISVIKDGRSVANNLPVETTPTSELIRLMTGREVASVFPTKPTLDASAPVVLEVENLELPGVFSGVDLTVRSGEILGLAGLVGSGRSEILETIYGARRADSGRVRLGGKTLPAGSVQAAVAAGMGLSPEERKSQGLILDEPIYRNVTLASFPRFARGGLLNEGVERARTREQLTALELRPADPDRVTRTLSGGNQQKILLARWLLHGTRVLLLDEPTRGVDVGARAEIYALIRELADSGTAVIVVSSEIDEVLGLSDRVLVVADGRVLHDGPADDLTESAVLDLVMSGVAA